MKQTLGYMRKGTRKCQAVCTKCSRESSIVRGGNEEETGTCRRNKPSPGKTLNTFKKNCDPNINIPNFLLTKRVKERILFLVGG